MNRVLAHLGVMSRMRIILSAGVCSLALNGCIPAAAGLALSAASLVTGGGSGGKGGEAFRNPIDRQTTGRQIRQALSRMNDQVDPACQAMLDEHHKTHGTLTAGKAVESTDPVAETPETAEPETAAGSTPGTPPEETTGKPVKKAPPPVNLLAKLEPVNADGPVSGDAAEVGPVATDAPVEATGTATSSDGEPAADAAGASVAQSNPDDDSGMHPVKASLESKPTEAPGHCEHRFVCLPGTPKPTLMLMCPGKGGKLAPEKTMASADTADGPVDPDRQAVPSDGESETSTQDETQTATAAVKQDAIPDPASNAAAEGSESTTKAGSGATDAAPPVIDMSVSADTAPPQVTVDAVPETRDEPARRTIESGGVADWNWSYDPAKQL